MREGGGQWDERRRQRRRKTGCVRGSTNGRGLIEWNPLRGCKQRGNLKRGPFLIESLWWNQLPLCVVVSEQHLLMPTSCNSPSIQTKQKPSDWNQSVTPKLITSVWIEERAHREHIQGSLTPSPSHHPNPPTLPYSMRAHTAYSWWSILLFKRGPICLSASLKSTLWAILEIATIKNCIHTLFPPFVLRKAGHAHMHPWLLLTFYYEII